MKALLQRGAISAGAFAFRMAERSPWFRERVLQPAVLRFVDGAVAAWRRGGVAAWERWYLPLMRGLGRGRAAYLGRKLRIDPTSARSLASVHDYEDPLLGIAGHWEEEGRNRAVRIETSCRLGERARAQGCPDFCRVLVHAFEEETLRALNPAYRLEPFGELLSAGDARCTFVHRVER